MYKTVIVEGNSYNIGGRGLSYNFCLLSVFDAMSYVAHGSDLLIVYSTSTLSFSKIHFITPEVHMLFALINFFTSWWI